MCHETPLSCAELLQACKRPLFDLASRWTCQSGEDGSRVTCAESVDGANRDERSGESEHNRPRGSHKSEKTL